MKSFWCFLFFGGILVSANLDHFKMDELSDSFKKYELTIPEGCDSEISSCIAGHHTEAKTCVEQWKQHSGKYIDECHQDSELGQLSKTWQEASFHWHKCVDKCLQGEDPPSDDHESKVFLAFLKRKKRSSHGGHSHHAHGGDMSDDGCFERVHNKAKECNAKVMECPALAKCWGMGDAPSSENANDATWFEHIKQLRETAKTSIADYKTKIMECVHKKRADEMNNMLKDSNMAALSSEFKMFNLSSSDCNPELWGCISSLHERALMCARLQQTENERSEKYDECTNNEDIKQARKDWEKASGNWHKALDSCMAGEQVPEEAEADAAAFLFRRKRNSEPHTPAEEEGPAHPHAHGHGLHMRGHGPRVFRSAAECWKDVVAHRRQCAQNALGCPQYAVCAATEGADIPDGKQAWFDHSKGLREKQEQTMHAYERKLHECLGTPEPAKAMEKFAEEQKNEESSW